MDLVILIVPAIIMASAAGCINAGFRDTERTNWNWIISGLVLFLLNGVFLFFVSKSGGLGGAVAFLIAGYLALFALNFGIILFVHLPSKRKAVSGIFGILTPLLFFISVLLGSYFTPEVKIEENGTAVVSALMDFRTEYGHYPNKLTDLIPDFLDDLNSPNRVWGWLYQTDGDKFSLGYVYWVDKQGYSVCVIGTYYSAWDCLPGSSGPFEIGPTPSPIPRQ